MVGHYAQPGQKKSREGTARASPRRGAPRGRQRGFSPDELEPSTSEGELVSDLLQGAAAELSGAPSSSAGSSDARAGSAGERRGRNHFRARLSVRLIDYECAAACVAALIVCAWPWCLLLAACFAFAACHMAKDLDLYRQRSAPDVQTHRGAWRRRYAGVNPVAFDIANNWCEYAADYHAVPPHRLDYSLLPDKAHQVGDQGHMLHPAKHILTCTAGPARS